MQRSDESAPPNKPPRRRPSFLWYGLGALLLVVGVSAFLLSLYHAGQQVSETLNRMQRVVAPGIASVEFEEPGRYLIYYEKVGNFEGRDFDTTGIFREAPALQIQLEQESSGEFVIVEQAKFDENESQMFNGGRANSEFAFNIQHPGRYVIQVEHETPNIDTEVLLAIGPPVVGQMMSDWRGPYGGAAVLAFTFVAGVIVILLVWTLRNGQVTRRAETE
jgi:hypothetical protein